jgi:hypothetical protein
MVVRDYFYLFLFGVLVSCSNFIGEDDELKTSRTSNLTNRLRLDGYYFTTTTNGEDSIVSIFFFYRNGILMACGSTRDQDLENVHDGLRSGRFVKKLQGIKYAYGLYQISRDSITYEKWHPSSGPPKVSFIKKGRILNDTTFTMSFTERSNGADKTLINEVYHFRRFHPKPDSTNEFIK